MNGAIRLFAAALFLTSVPAASRGELGRLGGEFRIDDVVNLPGLASARLAALPNGEFVALWRAPGQNDCNLAGIFARGFGAEGEPVTPTVRVDSSMFACPKQARVAALQDGRFIVVWLYDLSPRVMARIFDAQLNPLGEEFVVTSPDLVDLGSLDVTSTSNGQFVAVWSFGSGIDGLIAGQVIGSDGRLLGPPVAVSTGRVNACHHQPTIVAGPRTSFMVAWWAECGNDVSARLFDSLNQPRGREFVVATDVAKEFSNPVLCSLGSEGYAAAWIPSERIELNQAVRFREYDVDGKARSAETEVAQHDDGDGAYNPAIACSSTSAILVAWDQPHTGVRGSTFFGDPANGTQEFRIRDSSSTTMLRPSLVALGDGAFVATWNACDRQDGTCGIQGQKFTLNGPIECTGDCNRDGAVTVDEVITGVSIASGDSHMEVKVCLPADSDLDYRVTVDEVTSAVNRALGGCR